MSIAPVMQGDVSDFERAVLAALPDAVLIVSDTAEAQWANRAAEELFGISLEEGRGLSGLDLVHPDDLMSAALSLESVQGKEVGSPVELRVRAHDGWRLVEVIGRPFGDSSVVLVLRDLTERRKWEVAGGQAELARVVVQYAAAMTLLLDADGAVRGSSGGLARLLGIDQETVLGEPFAEIVAEEDRDLLIGTLASAAPGAPSVVEVHLRHGDGRFVPFALTIADLRDDPTVGGYVVSGHDISDRVRVEGELRSTLSLLESTLEATADGIVVVSRSGEVTAMNHQFIELWGLDPAEVGRGSGFSSVLPKMADPEGFQERIAFLYDNPELVGHDDLYFADGRVVERDSKPQRVGGEIVGRVWSFRDITDQVRLRQQLSHQAFHDPLTGLANQVLFRDRVEHALALARRGAGRIAVCFVDLDDFKTVNDSLGHVAGDELLVEVTRRLLGCVRGSDTVARLGGDEFAVLIEGADVVTDVEGVSDRILEALHRPIRVGTRDVVVTASIGIAYGDGSATHDDLLRNADLAMYTAKSGGKNRHTSFAPAMLTAAIERLETESQLRGAASRGELVVHYQPIVDLESNRTYGFEALVRWNHPERGLLAPGAFIPFAEQVGLIDEIGLHVLEVACAEAASWSPVRADLPAPSISVNLSARQLLDPELPERIADVLAATGLDVERLTLELTESSLMTDPLAAIESLRRLEVLGCRLAVDDFGTGYSSLAYLQQFPIHVLKVDRSFVSEIGGRGPSLAGAIVQLAQTLGLVPLAEGVETPAQMVALRELGCPLAQGYLLGRPADAVAIRARLDAERREVNQLTSTFGRSKPSASASA